MADETVQVLMRMPVDAANRLKAGAAQMSKELGHKVSVASYVQELQQRDDTSALLAEFSALVSSLKDAAAKIGPDSCANVFAFDVDGSVKDIRVVVEGGADFIEENNVGLFTLAELSCQFSECLGQHVHVRTQPRVSWCTPKRIDDYEREKIIIWKRGDDDSTDI